MIEPTDSAVVPPSLSAFSSSTTLRPRRAASTAAASPAPPPPMTARSLLISSPDAVTYPLSDDVMVSAGRRRLLGLPGRVDELIDARHVARTVAHRYHLPIARDGGLGKRGVQR